MSEPLLLILIALLVAFWAAGMRVREHAVRVVRRACERVGAQLLDETVALDKLRLGRDGSGQVRFRRHYRFEFNPAGWDVRQSGSVELLGRKVVHLHLEMDDHVLYEDSDPQ